MYIKNQKKLISIGIYIGCIITVIYLFSGLAFDSLNYLSQSEPGGDPGSWSYFSNKNSILDRTNITFLFIYPFSLFGIYLGGILYILMTTYLLKVAYRFIYSLRDNDSKSEIQDLILLYPYYIAYILLPGKESIVFFGILLIFYLSNILNESIAINEMKLTNVDSILLIIALMAICLIRPPLILILGPAILICFPFIRKRLFIFLTKKIKINSFIIINVFIGILIIGLITLLINPNYYAQGILGITKMSAFDKGTLSTNIINYELINNFELILPISLSTFLFGFPLFPYITENTLSIILGSYYGLTNIYLYYVIIQKIKFSKDLNIIAILFIPILIGAYILSIALSFNTGTGLRYALPYVEILWLIASIKPNQRLTSLN